MNEPTIQAVMRAAAQQLMTYPFKVWGFGEDIGLRGLWEISTALGERQYEDFVLGLLTNWSKHHNPLEPKDHVAPGVPLLLAFESTGETHFLLTALELAKLLENAKVVAEIPVHRHELEPWKHHIWVDCIYMDAPFLVRLWHITEDETYLEVAEQHIMTYLGVLREPESGLFFHGFDTRRKVPSQYLWGRGNAWAFLGMLETLEFLPKSHRTYPALKRLMEAQLAALVRVQTDSGHWYTILNDPQSPLETSLSALFAVGMYLALRLGLVKEDERLVTQTVADRAFKAALLQVLPNGGFLVSEATPVGDRENYVSRKFGNFPWGHGPLLLAATNSGKLK